MMIQNLIHKIGRWLYQDEIAKFEQEREELVRGRQFPHEEAISKRLDFVIDSFDGNKISLGSTSLEEDVVVLGADDSQAD